MEKQSHVIVSVEAYEELFNYLSNQKWKDVVNVIPSLINDINKNTQNFTVNPVTVIDKPEVKTEGLEIVK